MEAVGNEAPGRLSTMSGDAQEGWSQMEAVEDCTSSSANSKSSTTPRMSSTSGSSPNRPRPRLVAKARGPPLPRRDQSGSPNRKLAQLGATTPRDGKRPVVPGLGICGYDRYEKEFAERGKLGRGGQGTVFHVTNVLDDVDYAIKKVLLSSAAQYARRLQKVRREVKVLAQLSHKNIVRYYGSWLEAYKEHHNSPNGKHRRALGAGHSAVSIGTYDETETQMETHVLDDMTPSEGSSGQDLCMYIQMEHCTAGTLRDQLQKLAPGVPMELEKALEMLSQIASALRYIHSKKLIHRDLKPGNIFFGDDEQLKLGDFGLSRFDDHDETDSPKTPAPPSASTAMKRRKSAEKDTLLAKVLSGSASATAMA